MTTFDKREQAFENLFAHDGEMTFRAHARRDRALGLWAAELLGQTGEAAAEYAQTLISLEVEGNNDEALALKVRQDLEAGGVVRSAAEIRERMDQFLATAKANLARA